MLNTVKSKLTNLVVDSDSAEYIKNSLKDIIADIDNYEKTNATMTDMHSAFRALEDYNTLYHTTTENYYALDTSNYRLQIIHVQKILCILTMITSVIAYVLRKYSTNKDSSTGSLAKYLRMLNEQKDHFKSDKIMWTTMLKSLTTISAEVTSENAIREKEIMLKIAQVDKKDKSC